MVPGPFFGLDFGAHMMWVCGIDFAMKEKSNNNQIKSIRPDSKDTRNTHGVRSNTQTCNVS